MVYNHSQLTWHAIILGQQCISYIHWWIMKWK